MDLGMQPPKPEKKAHPEPLDLTWDCSANPRAVDLGYRQDMAGSCHEIDILYVCNCALLGVQVQPCVLSFASLEGNRSLLYPLSATKH